MTGKTVGGSKAETAAPSLEGVGVGTRRLSWSFLCLTVGFSRGSASSLSLRLQARHRPSRGHTSHRANTYVQGVWSHGLLSPQQAWWEQPHLPTCLWHCMCTQSCVKKILAFSNEVKYFCNILNLTSLFLNATWWHSPVAVSALITNDCYLCLYVCGRCFIYVLNVFWFVLSCQMSLVIVDWYLQFLICYCWVCLVLDTK